jgi:hypothetical protein
MNSMLSNGVPLDFDRTTLFIGFFGCYCAFNRSMLLVNLGMGCWFDLQTHSLTVASKSELALFWSF